MLLLLGVGASILDADLGGSRPGFMARMGYKRYFNSFLNAGLTFNSFNLRNDGNFDEQATSFDLNVEFTILPYDTFTPYIYTGGGANIMNSNNQFDWKFQFGLGVEYLISDTIGINLFGEQNFVFSDEVDGIESGDRDDFYYRFGVGMNIYLFNNKKYKVKSVSPVDGKTEVNPSGIEQGNN